MKLYGWIIYQFLISPIGVYGLTSPLHEASKSNGVAPKSTVDGCV